LEKSKAKEFKYQTQEKEIKDQKAEKEENIIVKLSIKFDIATSIKFDTGFGHRKA
jgi:hypothetical protein